MIRIYLSVLLIFCARLSFGQAAAATTSVQPPDGNKVILHTYAKGVQVYTCTQDPSDTSHYLWTFKEPKANLYADSSYHNLVGKHYLDDGKNPAWEYNDGSKVTGVKIQQANSPDALAIPWLLLKAAATTGTGTLTPTVFIQRIYTKGGKAPAIADRLHKGQTVVIRYTAEYLFYSKK